MENRDLILVTVDEGDLQRPDFYRMIGCEMFLGKPKLTKASATHVMLLHAPKERSSFKVLNHLGEIGIQVVSPQAIPNCLILKSFGELLKLPEDSSVLINIKKKPCVLLIQQLTQWERILDFNPTALIFSFLKNPIEEGQIFAKWLQKTGLQVPVIWHFEHPSPAEDWNVHLTSIYESIFFLPLGVGVWLTANLPLEKRYQLSFNILQASKLKALK